jgi:hypothetical protein
MITAKTAREISRASRSLLIDSYIDTISDMILKEAESGNNELQFALPLCFKPAQLAVFVKQGFKIHEHPMLKGVYKLTW